MKQDIHIIKTLDGKDKNANKNNLCIFCHFDKNNIIADYVIHYLTDLSVNCGFEIVFVSNSENLNQSEIAKIENLVSKVIIRKNIGYDFAAYFSGYTSVADKQKYKNILLANDSVYGPFYSLKNVFQEMENKADMWGITDNLFTKYHVQSYFLVSNSKAFSLLDDVFDNFEYIENKGVLVQKYEVGLSTKAIERGLKILSVCSHAKMIKFEHETNDSGVLSIKKSIAEYFYVKPSLKKIFSKNHNLYIKRRKFFYIYGSPHLTMWYSSIKYFSNPFIKVSLIKNEKMTNFHNFVYLGLIAEKYPNFNLNFLVSK
jgi:hypothetical protein